MIRNQISIAVIGDTCVGKTCLVRKIKDKDFDLESVVSTLGFNMETIEFPLNEDTKLTENTKLTEDTNKEEKEEKEEKITVDIYDISSILLERMVEWTSKKDLILLTYSIVDKHSFIHLESVLNSIRNKNIKQKPIYLVGTKSDLSDKREVSEDDVMQFMMRHDIKRFYSVTSTNSDIVNETVKNIVSHFIEDIKNGVFELEDSDSESTQSDINIETFDNEERLEIMNCCIIS